MRRLCRLFFVLAGVVILAAIVTAAQTTKTLSRQDCAVMEWYLRHQKGINVRVESGSLATSDQEVVAVLNVVKPDGTGDNYRYFLGRLDRQEVYEPGFIK